MRIGVIGGGVIGQLRAQSIRENGRANLAAVFDPSPSAALRAVAGSGAATPPSLDEFMQVDMDAVVVSSPVHRHEEACLAAFATGRHVLSEKPLSNTVESSRRIVNAALAADRVLAVGFNLRYYPAIRFVKDAIDSGMIGKLDHLRIFGGHEGIPKFRSDWEYRAPESGGGAMMDIGVHMSDLARHLLGEITEVYGIMSEAVWRIPGSEDNAIAIYRNPEGIYASYHATWTEWKGYQFYIEAYGDKGMVRGGYAPMHNLLITQDSPGGRRTTIRKHYPMIQLREKLKTWHSTALLSFAGELEDFLALVDGRPSGLLADGYAGLRSVEVSRAVRESGQTREVIHLPALGKMR